MDHPSALSEGSTVAVVSPAGPVVADILTPGLQTLRDWGLDVRLHDDVYETEPRHGYLAGADEMRLRAVQGALDDPEVEAIVFSRGGYGTMRILPDLDFSAPAARSTLLVGFSDLTALHLHVAGQLDLPTLHAPVVKSLRMHDPGDRSHDSLRDALFGHRSPPLLVDDLETVVPGRATGRVLGGNLTLLVHLLDSPYCPDLSDAILLLEDVGEEDYRLDRMFTALRLSEKAGRPAGILLGEFSDCDGAYVDAPDIERFVADLAAELDVPTITGFPSGHESPNIAVPMGVEATLDADSGRVEFAADAVRPPARRANR